MEGPESTQLEDDKTTDGEWQVAIAKEEERRISVSPELPQFTHDGH